MDSLFYAFYQNSAGQGVTGVTGTVDVYRVLKVSPFTSTLYLASGTMVAVGSGVYYIGVTGTDPRIYDYPAVFKSTGSFSSQWIPSIRWDDGALAGDYMSVTGTVSLSNASLSDIWNYVTRTLTAGGGSMAADIWSYVPRTLTQTAAQIISNVTDNTQIDVYKSSTFNVTLQNLPDFTGWQKMWFTVKEDVNFELSDSESIIQIQTSAPTGTASDGLLYINKDVATLTDGYLEVLSTTSVKFVVKASVTGNLPPKVLYYGIKYIDANGDVVPLSEGGEFVIHHSTSKKVT